MKPPRCPRATASDYQVVRRASRESKLPRLWTPRRQTRRSESLPRREAQRSSSRSLPAPRSSKLPTRTGPPTDFAAALENLPPPSKAMLPPKFPARFAAGAARKPPAKIPPALPRGVPPQLCKAYPRCRAPKSDTRPCAAKSPPPQTALRKARRRSKESVAALEGARYALLFHPSTRHHLHLRASSAHKVFPALIQRKRLRMQFPRELFNRSNQSRRRPVEFIAGHHHVPQFDSLQRLPRRPRAQTLQLARFAPSIRFRVVRRQHDVLRL